MATLNELIERGVLELSRGKIISKKDLASTPGTYPVYSSAQENDGKFGEYGCFMFDEELITWSVDGGGKFFHRTKHKFSVTNVGGILRIIDSSVLDYRFLYYVLTLRHSKIEFDWVRKAHPSVIRELYRDIPLPPLPEQRRIVDLLSRAEGIVRLRSEAEKKAAQLIPALFLDIFGDPATNPKGWPVALLPEVLSRPFKNGLYLPKEKYAQEGSGEGAEMVHMSDAFYGEVKRGHLRRVLADQKQLEDYRLTRGDLLVARRSLTFDGAARLCGVPQSDQPLLFESSFIRLTPNPDVVRTAFLLNYMNSESTRKAHVLSRISGITISGINQAAMNQIPVLVPPIPLQDSFISKVDQVLAIQSQQSTAATKAKAAFDAMLAQAFSTTT